MLWRIAITYWNNDGFELNTDIEQVKGDGYIDLANKFFPDQPRDD